VQIDYPAIVEILLLQLDNQRACSDDLLLYLFNICFPVDDEIQQSTALRWLADFLNFAHEVMVPFTPRLIPAILPNLAHHVTMIQSAAIRTNKLLLNVIQNLPSPTDASSRPATEKQTAVSRTIPASPTPTAASSNPSRQSTAGKESGVSTRGEVSSPEDLTETPAPSSVTISNAPLSQKSRGSTMQSNSNLSDMGPPLMASGPSRPQSPLSGVSALAGPQSSMPPSLEDYRLFDYQATVNELTIQFLSEHEDTRVAALKWLIMLHQKAPKDVSFLQTSVDALSRYRKILAMDDGTFPALLKTLSDSSEEVCILAGLILELSAQRTCHRSLNMICNSLPRSHQAQRKAISRLS
jgi:vacuole morphology and inheritance protein 14